VLPHDTPSENTIMMTPRPALSRFFWIALLGAPLFAGSGSARAEGSAVPQQVWFHDITVRTEKQRMKQYGLPKYASATTRMEAELQASVPVEELPGVRAQMDAMVKDPLLAERILGPGYSVVQISLTPRNVWDRYTDSHQGLLAATSASNRTRGENGVDKLNFKPPTGVRFANGVVHRVEAGVNVPSTPDGRPNGQIMKFLRNSRLVDNPLREFAKLYPGHQVDEIFEELSVDMHQDRAMYHIHKNGAKVNEVSVDLVKARDPLNPSHLVTFGYVEAEGDHITLTPTAAQAARQASTTWKGPHKATDTHNEALINSPEVKDVHRVSEALTALFNQNGLHVKPAGRGKYATARALLGKTTVSLSALGLRQTRSGRLVQLKKSALERPGRIASRQARAPRGLP
jgi:hypothetical protein